MKTWICALGALVCGCSGAASSTLFAAGGDAGADAPFEQDGSTITPADASGDAAVLPSVGPAYKACGPVTLGVTQARASGWELKYPFDWSANAQSANLLQITTRYRYVPTGSSTSVEAVASVQAYEERRTSEADALTRLKDIVSGWPNAKKREYTLSGKTAVSWWYEEPPPQPGCANCPGDPGPDIAHINTAVAFGTLVVNMQGSARVNAPDAIFCAIQAIETSFTAR